jgi:hypothetical protein
MSYRRDQNREARHRPDDIEATQSWAARIRFEGEFWREVMRQASGTGFVPALYVAPTGNAAASTLAAEFLRNAWPDPQEDD